MAFMTPTSWMALGDVQRLNQQDLVNRQRQEQIDAIANAQKQAAAVNQFKLQQAQALAQQQTAARQAQVQNIMSGAQGLPNASAAPAPAPGQNSAQQAAPMAMPGATPLMPPQAGQAATPPAPPMPGASPVQQAPGPSQAQDPLLQQLYQTQQLLNTPIAQRIAADPGVKTAQDALGKYVEGLNKRPHELNLTEQYRVLDLRNQLEAASAAAAKSLTQSDAQAMGLAKDFTSAYVANRGADARLKAAQIGASGRLQAAGVQAGARIRAAELRNQAMAPAQLSESDKAMADRIASYDMKPLSMSYKNPRNYAIMQEVLRINPNYDDTQYGAKIGAAKQFATGPLANRLTSLNVAIDHLGTVKQLAQALQSGNTPIINRAAQAVSTWTGGAAPTSFDAAMQIVGPEVIKAVVNAGGGVSERQEATRILSRVNSPAALTGALNSITNLLGGQARGLKRQYEAAGLTNFDARLSPSARAALGIEGSQSSSASGAPEVGAIEQGYRFKGGDPSKQSSWEKVK